MKRCNYCHEEKPHSEFYSKPLGRDGLTTRCKPCQGLYQKSRNNPPSPSPKTCSRCLIVKPPSEFTMSRHEKDGLEIYCRPCQALRRSERREAYRLAARKSNLKRNYGLELGEYNAILLSQGGACAICLKPAEAGKHLDVDHCHRTGNVRGLLCGLHNTGLGSFGDDPALLRAAAEYLERHSALATQENAA